MKFETLNEGEVEVVDTTEGEVDETSEETEEEIEEEEDETTTEKTAPVDYKAKYEDLQKKIAGDAFKNRKVKRSDEEEEGENEEGDKPLTESRLKALLDERETKILKVGQESKATEYARTLTESEDEALYAVELFKHVSLPFDTLEENMRFIIAGMNADRTLGQTAEIKRALKSKDTARKNTATTVRDRSSASQPAISTDVKAVLKTQGYKYISEKKVYGKKLANGKMLFSDGKGKTWVE